MSGPVAGPALSICWMRFEDGRGGSRGVREVGVHGILIKITSF